MNECSASMCACVLVMPGALRDQKRPLECIELARHSFALSCECCEPNLVPLQQLQVF